MVVAHDARVAAHAPDWLRVLIIEDDALLRWALVESLRTNGCTVAEAADGGTTLRVIAEAADPFDVVVLTHPLPDVPALTLLRTLQHLTPASAVVFMSAFGTPDLFGRARALGAVGVLQKPFEMAHLMRSVVDAAGA